MVARGPDKYFGAGFWGKIADSGAKTAGLGAGYRYACVFPVGGRQDTGGFSGGGSRQYTTTNKMKTMLGEVKWMEVTVQDLSDDLKQDRALLEFHDSGFLIVTFQTVGLKHLSGDQSVVAYDVEVAAEEDGDADVIQNVQPESLNISKVLGAVEFDVLRGDILDGNRPFFLLHFESPNGTRYRIKLLLRDEVCHKLGPPFITEEGLTFLLRKLRPNDWDLFTKRPMSTKNPDKEKPKDPVNVKKVCLEEVKKIITRYPSYILNPQ